MQTDDSIEIHLTLHLLTERDCEEIVGGDAFDGYIRGAADLLPVLICVFTGRICA